ncbi:hypothetical protein GCM10020331_066920 [Ectobacillus funiculus]
MFSDKLKINSKGYFRKKEFKTGLRGYQQEEVDKFLDLIIKDYETLHKEIEALQQEKYPLKNE